MFCKTRVAPNKPMGAAKAEMNRDQHLNIGLLWHSSNSGNLGVGALTVSNIAIVTELLAPTGIRAHFTILGACDDEPPYVTGNNISVFGINGRSMISPSGYWAKIGEMDCVLDIGAGDSFTDIYPAKRFLYLWTTKIIAILRGKPLLFSPQTIGPFSKSPWKQMAGMAMGRAFAVVARDPLSYAAVSALAPTARCVQAVDVAFALPYTPAESRTQGQPKKIGINVSGLLYNGGYSGKNEFGLSYDYAAFTHQLLDQLTKRSDVEVHLVTHVVTANMPEDDDSRVADKLAKAYPAAVRAPDFASPSDAKSYISGLDLLIAGRMHACIAAISSGVPVIPVSYSRKFAGLFQGVLDYPFGINPDQGTTEDATAYVVTCIDSSETMKKAVTKSLSLVEAGLNAYRAVLLDFFSHVDQGSRR
jgi:colanic acid/amylovoran biosynthesis protein